MLGRRIRLSVAGPRHRWPGAALLLLASLIIPACDSAPTPTREPTATPSPSTVEAITTAVPTMPYDGLLVGPTATPTLREEEWPSFSMVFIADSTDYTARTKWLYDYVSPSQWVSRAIVADEFEWEGRTYDRTGSWKSQSGFLHVDYDAAADRTEASRMWGFWSRYERRYIHPPGDLVPSNFREFWMSGQGEAEEVEFDFCVGDECHDLPTGSSMLTGRRIGDKVFTEGGIPVVFDDGSIEVLSLQLWPTESSPYACWTNLRTLHDRRVLRSQRWLEDCIASRGSGFSRYYVFTLDQPRFLDIVASSRESDLYLHLWPGTDMTGRTVERSDDVDPVWPDGHSSGVQPYLQPGTYTVEIEAESLGEEETPSGWFSFSLDICFSQLGVEPPPGITVAPYCWPRY